MGSPINLGHVSLGDYEDKSNNKLKGECIGLCQRMADSPFFICSLNNREELVCLHAYLKEAMRILETNAEQVESEENGRSKTEEK